MKTKIFKLIVIMAIGIAFLTGTTMTAYAHDPSATPHPDKSHIHIKGRVTTPDGVGIQYARIPLSMGRGAAATPFNAMLSGLPGGCVYSSGTPGAPGGGGLVETDSQGFYEILIYINTDPHCMAAFDRVTVNKAQIPWRKEGYEISPR